VSSRSLTLTTISILVVKTRSFVGSFSSGTFNYQQQHSWHDLTFGAVLSSQQNACFCHVLFHFWNWVWFWPNLFKSSHIKISKNYFALFDLLVKMKLLLFNSRNWNDTTVIWLLCSQSKVMLSSTVQCTLWGTPVFHTGSFGCWHICVLF
jgi:hypothetical protein